MASEIGTSKTGTSPSDLLSLFQQLGIEVPGSGKGGVSTTETSSEGGLFNDTFYPVPEISLEFQKEILLKGMPGLDLLNLTSLSGLLNPMVSSSLNKKQKTEEKKESRTGEPLKGGEGEGEEEEQLSTGITNNDTVNNDTVLDPSLRGDFWDYETIFQDVLDQETIDLLKVVASGFGVATTRSIDLQLLIGRIMDELDSMMNRITNEQLEDEKDLQLILGDKQSSALEKALKKARKARKRSRKANILGDGPLWFGWMNLVITGLILTAIVVGSGGIMAAPVVAAFAALSFAFLATAQIDAEVQRRTDKGLGERMGEAFGQKSEQDALWWSLGFTIGVTAFSIACSIGTGWAAAKVGAEVSRLFTMISLTYTTMSAAGTLAHSGYQTSENYASSQKERASLEERSTQETIKGREEVSEQVYTLLADLVQRLGDTKNELLQTLVELLRSQTASLESALLRPRPV